MRIGFGYDVHRLVEGRKLIIGGVQIEHTHGLLGHSDADVLIHAICAALLGAGKHRLYRLGRGTQDRSAYRCDEKRAGKGDEHTVCRYRNKGYDKRADRVRRTKRGYNGLCRGFDKKK